MTPLDFAVVAAVAAALGLPYIRSFISIAPWPSAPKADRALAWRQKWAATIIDLLEEVESGQGTLERPAETIRLARELIWEVIGGDGPQPSKPK